MRNFKKKLLTNLTIKGAGTQSHAMRHTRVHYEIDLCTSFFDSLTNNRPMYCHRWSCFPHLSSREVHEEETPGENLMQEGSRDVNLYREFLAMVHDRGQTDGKKKRSID